MNFVLLTALLGTIGVLCRFGVDRALGSTSSFPVSTFVVNVAGSLLAGVVFVLFREKGMLSPPIGTAFAVGFLGGFTTFSSFALQSVLLFEEKNLGVLAMYFVGSPVLCALSAWAGIHLARTIS